MSEVSAAEVVVESDALHARVQAFQSAAMRGETTEPFDELALAIGRFQARYVAPVRRLVHARRIDLDAATSAAALPAVPTDVFRLARVAAHPPALDVAVFRTSGTTQGARGEHALRRTDTYELGAVAFGRRKLWPDRDDLDVCALAPSRTELVDSSLSFMIDRFDAALAGRGGWYVREGAIDIDGVERACERARREDRPLLIAGASFAFVHLADGAGSRDLRAPPGSRAMITGGFKGRSRELDPAELRGLVARTFELDEARGVVSEYGMTELSSQLYDTVVAGGAAGVYQPPPWLRVDAVDPVALEPVGQGEVGIARFVDLANVDSTVAVVTADRIRVTTQGIELLGRMPGATPRGCALAMDEMLGG